MLSPFSPPSSRSREDRKPRRSRTNPPTAPGFRGRNCTIPPGRAHVKSTKLPVHSTTWKTGHPSGHFRVQERPGSAGSEISRCFQKSRESVLRIHGFLTDICFPVFHPPCFKRFGRFHASFTPADAHALREDGILSAMRRKMNPRAKKMARDATAILMVPPANLTTAITAEPRKLAPLAKMS